MYTVDPYLDGLDLYDENGDLLAYIKDKNGGENIVLELNRQAKRIAELEAEKNRNQWYWCAVHITSALASVADGGPTTISDTPKAVEKFARTLINKLTGEN